jgi:tetratricopeptide (TPR) repeat protein
VDAPADADETAPAPRAVVRRPPIFGWRAWLVIAVGALGLFAVASVWLFAGSPVSNFVIGVGQATGLLSRVPTATTRGIEAYRAGDLQTAERELSDAARTYPASGLALLYLARIKIDTGDPDAAAPLFEEAVAREPNNPVGHRMLGEYHLTRARRGPGDGSNRIYTATELIAAEAELERAMALDPKDILARGYHACALAVGGRMVEAKIELASAGPGPWEECVNGEEEK